ncbi:hypothetical protein BH23CHL5_BH23CHL5_20890 [soil metagenome]
MTALQPARPANRGRDVLPPELVIERADTERKFQQVIDLRRTVFHDEQHLVDMILTDSDDERSVVLIASLHGVPVATGRLTPPSMTRRAYLSWIATLPARRRQGIATAIVAQLVKESDRRRLGDLHLSAQVPAIELYARFGFTATGSEFTVRNIPHVPMTRVRRT